MADALYLHPAKQEADARYDEYVASNPYPMMPVGVVGLANTLRKEGWSVRGLNLPLALMLKPTFSLREWLSRQGRPRLVMLDLHWYEHSLGALDAARAAKEVYPDVPVLLGGLTASGYARDILNAFPQVDYVIRGDAEVPLRQLAASLDGATSSPGSLAGVPNLTYREGSALRENRRTYVAAASDLDGLDCVDLSFLEHHLQYATLQYTGAGRIEFDAAWRRGHWLANGRGCIFECGFCGGNRAAHKRLAGREGFVLRSVERTVEDVVRLKANRVHQVSLALDPSVIGPQYWKPLFSQLSDRKVKVGLYNEFFQLPTDELLEALLTVADLAHTEIALSPLSGDERVRRLNGKPFSNKRLSRVLATLAERRVPVFVYFSLNLPGETSASFRETLGLAQQIGGDYPPSLLRMINTCHTMDPLSPMSQTPSKYGIRPDYRSFADYYAYCQQTAWQPRTTIRGSLRGFSAPSARPAEVEERARKWDAFAEKQPFQCFPVPSGW